MLDESGFGSDAHRYYLSEIDSSVGVYTHGGKVTWPPEAGPPVVKNETGDRGCANG